MLGLSAAVRVYLATCPSAKGAAMRSRLATVRRPVHSRAAPISRAKRWKVGRVKAGAIAWRIGRASFGTIIGGHPWWRRGSRFNSLCYRQGDPPKSASVELRVYFSSIWSVPFPLAGAPYAKAHSLIANAPLPMLFLLDAGQLPKGFAYQHLEHAWMVEPLRPGDAPALLLRFSGRDPYEALVEGSELIGLCDLVGRHLIHWMRQHPTGRDDGTLAVFIRRITIRKGER